MVCRFPIIGEECNDESISFLFQKDCFEAYASRNDESGYPLVNQQPLCEEITMKQSRWTKKRLLRATDLAMTNVW